VEDLKGFWSYVHDDNDAEGGRIVQLANDVCDQFQMITGEKINLFLDKNSLEWGNNWQKSIDGNLNQVAFFIPIITRRFFLSSECRKELKTFASKATALGENELILSLLYVDFPGFSDNSLKDELIDLIKTFQWIDWTPIRFKDRSSEEYRFNVYSLAEKLAKVNQNLESQPIEIISNPLLVDQMNANSDDSLGTIDKLALAEQKFTEWHSTTEGLNSEIRNIGELMNKATEETKNGDRQGKGFSNRLLISQKLARQLADPVQRVWELCDSHDKLVIDIDQGIRIMINQALPEIKKDPSSKDNFCKFFASVNKLADSSIEAFASTKGFIDSLGSLENISRDLRPVIRKLKLALTIFCNSEKIIKEWVGLINSSEINCPEESS
jgi:hypothetical protein